VKNPFVSVQEILTWNGARRTKKKNLLLARKNLRREGGSNTDWEVTELAPAAVGNGLECNEVDDVYER